jgi:hypothetical protein
MLLEVEAGAARLNQAGAVLRGGFITRHRLPGLTVYTKVERWIERQRVRAGTTTTNGAAAHAGLTHFSGAGYAKSPKRLGRPSPTLIGKCGGHDPPDVGDC